MSKTVGLGEFCRYVAQQEREIRNVYTEIEEVQQQFNEFHRQLVQAQQAALADTLPMLDDESALPPALAQSLLTVVDQERAKLEQEMAEVATLVEARREEADRAIAQAQAELEALRQVNPQLDAEEEAIKAQCTAIQRAIPQFEAEIKALPWLTGFFRRRRLRKELEVQRANLVAELGRLREVRERWLEEKRGFQATQAELQSAWQVASTEAAKQQARLDYLQANVGRLSRERGAARFLAELEQAPEAPEPLAAALAKIAELNRTRAEYEAGLRAVAEALGLLKGLAEGMERFGRSADKVLEEQRRYNLRQLRLELSDVVLGFHSLWPALRAQVKDEKTLGAQPAEFSRRVRAAIDGRLSDDAIAAMFESMGDALTRATKAWD